MTGLQSFDTASFEDIFQNTATGEALYPEPEFADMSDDAALSDADRIEDIFLQLIEQGTQQGILDICDPTAPAAVIGDPAMRAEMHALYGRALLKNPALRFYVRALKDNLSLQVKQDSLFVHFPSEAYIIKNVSKLGGYPFTEDTSPMAEILNGAYSSAVNSTGKRLVTMRDLGYSNKATANAPFSSAGKKTKADGITFDPSGEIFNQESFTTAPKTNFNVTDLPDENIADRLYGADARASKDAILRALASKGFSADRAETIYSLYRDMRDSADLSSGVR